MLQDLKLFKHKGPLYWTEELEDIILSSSKSIARKVEPKWAALTLMQSAISNKLSVMSLFLRISDWFTH